MGTQYWGLSVLAILASSVIAQNCVSLEGSKQCPAFGNASISTDSALTGLFPFLSFVSSVETFDQQLGQYINFTYVESKYRNGFGCDNVNLTNTTDYYARYTASFLCNAIIQNSTAPCGLPGQTILPLCADDCAQHAITEEEIIANKQLCGTPGASFIDQIRADFITCSLPNFSLTGDCIHGAQNEPENCGFASNLDGLCRYCGTSLPNATDPCCYDSNASNATGVCSGVVLPSLGPLPSITFATTRAMATLTTTAVATGTSTATSTLSNGTGLLGGAIAGIVIGSIVALICFSLIVRSKRRERYLGASLNLPSPPTTMQKAQTFESQHGATVDREPGVAIHEEPGITVNDGSGVAVHGEPGVAIDEKDGTGTFIN